MKIKNCIMVIVVLLLYHSKVLAFDPMGPPAAGLKQNQFSASAEYLYSNIDLKADSLTINSLIFDSATIKNIKSNKIYSKLGYGLNDNWELFLRLGAADADPDKSDNSNNLAGFIGGSDYAFAIGGGTKVTFYESEDAKKKWGALAQMSWAGFDFDKKTYSYGGYTGTLSAEVEIVSVQIALGPTCQLLEGVSVYGGPFFHFVDGDADVKGTINGFSGKGSTDLEQDSLFGGYIGLQAEHTKNLNTNVEFQSTGSGYAFVATLVYKF